MERRPRVIPRTPSCRSRRVVFKSTLGLIDPFPHAQLDEARAPSSMHTPPRDRLYHRAMVKEGMLLVLTLEVLAAGCGGGSSGPRVSGSAGSVGAAGATGSAGAAGSAGATGSAGAQAGMGGSSAGGSTGQAGGAGQTSGAAGAQAGAGGGDAGVSVDAKTDVSAAGGSSGAGGTGAGGSGGSMSFLPAGYTGTPFAALKIPGRINACDYDRGGAGVAWCHNTGACGSGTVTGDYPGGSGVYRPPIPATAQLCSGAACADNVGVCRMNPAKPDNTIMGQPMPPTDTYLCYSVAGEWTKYTVVVEQAGTYAVGGVMAVPQGGGVNLSFGANITTGNLMLAITPTTHSGSGENYHSWDTRDNLATVTFPAAGTYLMTLTQVGRFNADAFIFTKM